MDPSKESFMNLNQAEQRRNFIKLAFGVSSAAWATSSSANSTASTFKGSSLETQLLRLPPNTEPMVVSGRVTGPQNKPCCDQSVMTNSQQIDTGCRWSFLARNKHNRISKLSYSEQRPHCEAPTHTRFSRCMAALS